MSNPTVTNVVPAPDSTDSVLGQPIVVTFDQILNTDSVNNATFALTGPDFSSMVTADQIIEINPEPSLGRDFILGTYAFATVSGKTVLTFTPASALRPGITYTVLVVGKDSPTAAVIGSYVINPSGDPMLASYQWSFTTGTLNIKVPPVQNPIPTKFILDPNTIQVIPRPATGNDLTQIIELIFPAPIDTNVFNVDDILVGIEPILGDPDVQVPPGAYATAVVQGNKIIVTVSGLS
jgi:hypothetical protein